MKPQFKRICVLCLGWFFILFGIAGLFLPIVQGILLLLIGFFILSHESPWAKGILNKIMIRYPAINERFDAIKAKNGKLLKKLFNK